MNDFNITHEANESYLQVLHALHGKKVNYIFLNQHPYNAYNGSAGIIL